jgi:hypothetical protein
VVLLGSLACSAKIFEADSVPSVASDVSDAVLFADPDRCVKAWPMEIREGGWPVDPGGNAPPANVGSRMGTQRADTEVRAPAMRGLAPENGTLLMHAQRRQVGNLSHGADTKVPAPVTKPAPGATPRTPGRVRRVGQRGAGSCRRPPAVTATQTSQLEPWRRGISGSPAKVTPGVRRAPADQGPTSAYEAKASLERRTKA